MFVLLFFLAIRATSSGLCQAQCWFPDGSLAKDDQPCYPDRSDSFCCGTRGQTCSDDKLCLGLVGFGTPSYNRGSCTDRTWKSPECPKFCYKGVLNSFIGQNLIHSAYLSCRYSLGGRWRNSSALRGQRILLSRSRRILWL